MKQTKLDYSAPQAETFVVRFEGMVCTSPGVSVGGATRGKGYLTDPNYFIDDDED